MMPYSMKLAKKRERKLNLNFKNEGYFFGQYPVVEKSPTATNIIHIYVIDVILPSQIPVKRSKPSLCAGAAFAKSIFSLFTQAPLSLHISLTRLPLKQKKKKIYIYFNKKLPIKNASTVNGMINYQIIPFTLVNG